MKKFLSLNLPDAVFIMLINVKMPTIVDILTFMSRINEATTNEEVSCFALNLSDIVFIMLINVKMPTIIGI